MSTIDYIDLPGFLAAAGSVRLPGSKSISNRVLLIAALAEGTTEIRDLLESDDTARMLDALQTLGVRVTPRGERAVRVEGCGGDFPVKSAELFLGNAGTAFRPLTAALALNFCKLSDSETAGDVMCDGYVLKGVARMHERPIGDLVDGLRQLGCGIDYLGKTGFPPLHVRPVKVEGGGTIHVRGDVSSQFLTALLMALPLTGRETRIEVEGELISKPYIEITLAMMRRFGVEVTREGWAAFVVPGGARYQSPGTVYVEGDASSASYFLAAGMVGNSKEGVRVEGVGADSVQGDIQFAAALEKMGARITMGPNWVEARPPLDGVVRAIDLDCNHIPDAAMTLAVAALFAKDTTTLRNIASWRVKETDRIAAMATELRKLGATVEEGADYIRVTPPIKLATPAEGIDTYDDHRMAMCFSLAALTGTPVRINDPECVGKTFPEYFHALAGVVTRVPAIAIDGPSASGKGTVAARVAEALGFAYLDSGSLYRLTALAARRAGVDWADERRVAAIAASLEVSFRGDRIYLDGEDVSEAIRTEEMSAGASKVAVLPAVRDALLFLQRAFRKAPGVVGDGRDMASVVFPDASLKVFLTASPEARAERRYKQLIGKGNAVILSDLLKDLKERDARDSQRAVAPLRQGEDALLLDTTSLTIDQAVDQVLRWWRDRSG
jgi:3-phosphoshikimate 1-carboxyvinyltransferase